MYSVNANLNGSSWTANYSYDQLNRLTGAATTGAYPMTSSYKYDKNGNRLSGSTLSSGASIPYNYTYQYDTANQLKQVNSSTCTNDGNGNQTGCGTSYKETYNPRNQTTSMSSPNGALNDQYVGVNSNERVQTTGTNAASYTYNALGLGTEKNGSNLIAYTRDNKGNLVSERTSGGNYYYLLDGLGSVVALMPPTADGTTNTYVYDAYGVTQHQTGTQYNPWQFASGYFDASTLYYKYGTRYYDRFGRWTQKDSQPSANPYTYAGDDPVNETDPNGQSDCLGSILSNGWNIISALSSLFTGSWWALFYVQTLEAEIVVGSPPTVLIGIAQTAIILAASYAAVRIIRYYGNIIGNDCVGHDIL